MARPQKEIDWNEVELRMKCGENAKTISQRFNIDTDTFYRRFKEEFSFSFGDYSAVYYEIGNQDILYTQFINALAGNTKLLELLGRERCGQGKEKEAISPYEELINLKHEMMMLRAENQRLKENLNNELPTEDCHKPKTKQEFLGSDSSV